jgi:hypothetical protein
MKCQLAGSKKIADFGLRIADWWSARAFRPREFLMILWKSPSHKSAVVIFQPMK